MQLLSQDTKLLAQQFMIGMLKRMMKSEEFLHSVVVNENVTCHLLKVLMTKCGHNKILLSIIKIIFPRVDMKNNHILYTIIMNYNNKYG